MSQSYTHVVFGSGPLGRAVVRALQRRGQPVRVVNRGGGADIEGARDVRALDVFDAAAMDNACADAAVVYQCANPVYHRWPEDFPPLQGVILDAAARAGARLVIADNLYCYGDTDGRPITEELPYDARTRKGRTRALMARAALDAHAEGRLSVVIGRGSDFFGPHVLLSAMGERAIAPLLRGKSASVLGNPDLPHTYTYIDDFAEALVLLGGHDDAAGRAWHVPSSPAITTREFVERLGAAAGVPPRLAAAGRGMLRLAGIFSPGAREMVEMMYEFEKPFIADSSQFEQRFGVHATALDEAIHTTVDWYRAQFRI